MTTDAVLALNRFGVGARPGEVARIAADPRGWLRAQLSQPAAALIDDPALPSSDAAARQLAQARRAKRDPAAEPAAQPVDPGQPVDKAKAADPGQVRRTIGRAEFAARLAHGVATEAGFVERLALFFANHFAVSADKGLVRVLAGAFEREAIRPHVLGRFADMLRAVQRHPAMLVYLDNQRSVGPGSVAGARRGLGLNENLARETLELHTLGVDGGYGQADVTALAAVLTGRGWVPPRADRPDAGRFLFSPNRHEPGPATILGRTYEPGGLEQGDAVLDALARHPATARHLARKLATHFIADDPPDGAVARLATAYREGDGDLAVVAAALVATPEAWDPAPRKFKTPYEFVLSAARLVPGIGAGDGRTLR
ncbi:DUF1800 domain-containing protein, partial [Methylobacterium sp. WL120]|uniref:DUF1800 domain-containing protein n=1 Tax=Methylobacterium sp. WL120 TaxID=2603887 RepID=UPI0011C82A89